MRKLQILEVDLCKEYVSQAGNINAFPVLSLSSASRVTRLCHRWRAEPCTLTISHAGGVGVGMTAESNE